MRISGRHWEPGVPGEAGKPDFRLTSRTRNPPNDSVNPWSSGWLRNSEICVIPKTRSSVWFGKAGFCVTQLAQTETGVRGDSGNFEFRVIQGTHSSACIWKLGVGFWVHPGTRISRWPRKPEVLRVIPGTRNSPVDSGKSEFPVIPSTRSSVWFRKPEFRVTCCTWSSGLFREPGIADDLRKSEHRFSTRNRKEPGIPGDSGNHGSGTVWFWVPGVPGDSANPEWRVIPGTRSSG